MIETARLVLRPWTQADKPAFHDVVNTPAVMAHFGGVAPRAQIDALIDAQIAYQARDGHSMWAVETRDGALAGICGVRIGGYPDTPVPEVLEIGWRLARDAWGRGYALEAAGASLAWGWANLEVPTIAAITVPANTRSWGLMERLGMHRVADGDFDHPERAEGDPLRRHILYRIARPA